MTAEMRKLQIIK